mmetsp:Transcript_32461/g.91987  ORF Transcript_32461/g.91987 Transcript_32461/m.91987 type:complete len:277 (-) Transcript_32461:1212-2042(-)
MEGGLTFGILLRYSSGGCNSTAAVRYPADPLRSVEHFHPTHRFLERLEPIVVGLRVVLVLPAGQLPISVAGVGPEPQAAHTLIHALSEALHVLMLLPLLLLRHGGGTFEDHIALDRQQHALVSVRVSTAALWLPAHGASEVLHLEVEDCGACGRRGPLEELCGDAGDCGAEEGLHVSTLPHHVVLHGRGRAKGRAPTCEGVVLKERLPGEQVGARLGKHRVDAPALPAQRHAVVAHLGNSEGAGKAQEERPRNQQPLCHRAVEHKNPLHLNIGDHH